MDNSPQRHDEVLAQLARLTYVPSGPRRHVLYIPADAEEDIEVLLVTSDNRGWWDQIDDLIGTRWSHAEQYRYCGEVVSHVARPLWFGTLPLNVRASEWLLSQSNGDCVLMLSCEESGSPLPLAALMRHLGTEWDGFDPDCWDGFEPDVWDDFPRE